MKTLPRIAIPHWRAPTWERTKYYHDSLRLAKAEALVVDGQDLPAEAAGLLLTGGVDVDPRLYGEKRHSKTERSNEARDSHELGLLWQALERDMPVLAICRGYQLLNVAFGGSLLQHVEADGHRTEDGVESNWHEVSILGGRLADAYPGSLDLRVNSRHHQAITEDRAAASLIPLARSPDRLVEAAESREHAWVVGVQWHPERPEMRPEADRLFAAFVAACYR